MSKEIDNVGNILDIAKKNNIVAIHQEFEPIKCPKWWIREAFESRKISFHKGVFLTYLSVVVPALFFSPWILTSSQIEFQIGYFAAFLGSITIFVVLIPLNEVRGGQEKLAEHINEHIATKFVAQASLINEKNVSGNKLKKLDSDYQDLYIKPVIMKTISSGYDLSFNKRYQIVSGLIGSGVFTVLFFSRYALNVISPSALTFWIPITNPEVGFAWLIYSFFVVAILWFFIGILAWSLMIVFLISLQVSSQTVEIRSFESIRDVFHPNTSLVLRTSFALTAIVAWASPYILVWGIIPLDSIARTSAINFLEAALAVLIPIIVLSFAVPFFTIHKGMERSKLRALRIKRYKLDMLQKKPLPDISQNLHLQNHLVADYRLIAENAEWSLNATELLEVFGTILLPIITFLLSRLP